MADLLSVEDAARLLGVIPQRVRALIAAGRLPAERVGRGFVVERAVLEQFAQRPRARGRPLSAANAWALLGRLAGVGGDFETRPVRSQGRIKSLLIDHADAVAVALRRSEPRSVLHWWRVLPNDLELMLIDPRLVKSGLSADDAGIDVRYQPSRDGIDAYVCEPDLRRLRRELRPLEDSSSPNVLLRVPVASDWILDQPVAPSAVVAADLLEHPDPRVERAARDALSDLLR